MSLRTAAFFVARSFLFISPFPSVFESFDAMSPDVGVFGGDAESFVEWSGIAP
jgi:hypothetical protein